MAHVLYGAVARRGSIEATFQFSAFGSSTKVATKREDWSPETLAAAVALIDAADAESAELDDVVAVQIYTPITAPEPTAFGAAGDLLDITLRGASPSGVRVGDDEAIPAALAAARDAFRSAVEADLG